LTINVLTYLLDMVDIVWIRLPRITMPHNVDIWYCWVVPVRQ